MNLLAPYLFAPLPPPPPVYTPNTPGAAVDRTLLPLSCVPFHSISTFSDSSSTVGNINSRDCKAKGGRKRNSWMWQTQQCLFLGKKKRENKNQGCNCRHFFTVVAWNVILHPLKSTSLHQNVISGGNVSNSHLSVLRSAFLVPNVPSHIGPCVSQTCFGLLSERLSCKIRHIRNGMLLGLGGLWVEEVPFSI